MSCGDAGACVWWYGNPGHYACNDLTRGALSTDHDPSGVLPKACPGATGTCHPDCTGRECGADGCGGVCGTCGATYCEDFSAGLRQNTGTCGGTGSFCANTTWPPNYTNAAAAQEGCCDGPVYKTCDPGAGVVAFSCDSFGTDLRCGVPDGSLKYGSIPVGCVTASTVQPLPDCANGCKRACTGKTCGDDGCGGSCGTCPSGQQCNNGTCATPTCSPACVRGQVCTFSGCQFPSCLGPETESTSEVKSNAVELWGTYISPLFSDTYGGYDTLDHIPAIGQGVKAVAIGAGAHVVAIDGAGAPHEWGPPYGINCLSVGPWRSLPATARPLSTVSASECSFIGIYGTGKVVVWGHVDPSVQSLYADGISDAVAVAAGWDFLVLHADGTVSEFSSFGPSASADLGILYYKYHGTKAGDALWDSTSNQLVSYVAAVPGIANVTAIAARGSHYVALNGDGTPSDWGSNDWSYTYGATAPVDLAQNVVQLAAGAGWSLALIKSGALRLWIDDPTNPRAQYLLAHLPTTHDFVQVADGYSPGGLRADGSIVTWDTVTPPIPSDLGFVQSFTNTRDPNDGTFIGAAFTKCASVCTPTCTANTCTSDGCGGLCPTCGGCDPSTATCPCVAQCSGRHCGDDSCGGTCGSCGASSVCTSQGQCACQPSCTTATGAQKQCGSNGCGGICGAASGCPSPQTCQPDGTCACVKQCDGKQCGDDGCGGTCGACGSGQVCSPNGKCDCAPACTGKQCGDDGCGGACGTCAAGLGCNASGQCVCVPKCTETVCDRSGCVTATLRKCGDDGCGGSCGACPSGQTCTPDGTACGCVGSCAGKECGDDGCGNPCGFNACPGSELCVQGHCACNPAGHACPTPRDGIQFCGTDICGKSCGACGPGEQCSVAAGDSLGVCVCAPNCAGRECGPDGCGGSCGWDQFNGPGCAGKYTPLSVCTLSGTCTCVPFCNGKHCGSDGCGGTCGKCAAGLKCSDGDSADPLYGHGACECVPQCSGKTCGADGCGGVCGPGCNANLSESCNYETGQCTADPCANFPAAGCCETAANGDSVQVYCDATAHKLKLRGCGKNAWACGWSNTTSTDGLYACGGDGYADPSGAHPIACPASVCVPDCYGKQCGDDGCGGSCGDAPCGGIGAKCVESRCIGGCFPQCGRNGHQCGDDGCGGSCGSCAAGQECAASVGKCCTPSCTGKACGDDGCGGTCGACGGGQVCDAGQCKTPACNGFPHLHGCCTPDNFEVYCDPATNTVKKLACSAFTPSQFCGWNTGASGYRCGGDATYPVDPSASEPYLCPSNLCVPQCNAKNCGPDGCGGTCGACASGDVCAPGGNCYTPCQPQCDGVHCGGGSYDGCGGACGCASGQACKPGIAKDQYGDNYNIGTCVAPCEGQAPVGVGCCANNALTTYGDTVVPGRTNGDVWTCPGATANSALDLQVTQCPANQTCGWSAPLGKFTCGGTDTAPSSVTAACPASCSCKGLGGQTYTCGDDGCGNSCGTCDSSQACREGHYCEVCSPKCGADYVCGDDGCGHSCGTCPGMATCDGNGACQLPSSCGSVTGAGACSGDTAQWCTDYGALSLDCTQSGGHCANGACVAGAAGASAHACASGDCGKHDASWACQCDAACAARHDCCGNYDSVCGAATSLGRCGDGACESGAGEDCLTCPADCGACASVAATSSAAVAPYAEVLRDATFAGQSASFEIVPIDDARPSGPPWPRKGLVAYLPEPGVNASSPHTFVALDGAVTDFLGRAKSGQVLTVADGVQGNAFSFNGTATFHDPGLCNGKKCGDDGAGGSCGTCPSGLTCDAFMGDCYDPNSCVEDSSGNGTGNNCQQYGVAMECGSSGCGRACGSNGGACPNGGYCNIRGKCAPKANVDSWDFCKKSECGPTGYFGLSCGTCAAGKACQMLYKDAFTGYVGRCEDGVSSDGVVRVVPEVFAPRTGSAADHTEGGATLAFWARVSPGSLANVNPLAATRSFKSGGEQCTWTRPGDAKVTASCPDGAAIIVGADAYWGSVESAPWPDGTCDTYRRIRETGTCASAAVAAAAKACVGKESCTLDYRNSADPCASGGSVLALRVVCDRPHAAATTLYVGDANDGNRLHLSLPGAPDLVSHSAFTAKKWTHVAVSHERIARGMGDVTLWMDGAPEARAHDVDFPDAYEWDLGAGYFPDFPNVPNAINGDRAFRASTGGALLSFTAAENVAGTADVDDVFLYDRALTSHELESLYRKPSVGALRVWPAVDPARALLEPWAGTQASAVPVEAKALLDPARSTSQKPVHLAADEAGLALPSGTTFVAADAAPDLASLSTFTLAGWVRPSKLAAGAKLLELTEGTKSQLALSTASACSGGALTASVAGGAALAASTTCAHGLAANDWAFVAYVQDKKAGSQAVYVDGVLTASGTAPAAIFTATDGSARALHAGDGADLAWAALYTTVYTPDQLEALRSQGPAVWVEGTIALDLAAFHNNASGAATDAAVLWSGASGIAVAGSGATVTVPARGRFRTLGTGAERAFSWSGQVGLPSTIGAAAAQYPLFELDQPGSRLADAELACKAADPSGFVACHVLVNGIGADGKFHHWSSDDRIAKQSALATATARLALAFDEAPAGAIYLESGGSPVALFTVSGAVGSALTMGEVGSAGAAPASTAAAEQFVLPSPAPGGGATWSDVRLYARVLGASELGALVLRGCAAQRCGDQSRVCATPAALSGAGAATIDLTVCGGCASGLVEHAGKCFAKQDFDGVCVADVECASGACGPDGTCLETAQDASCTNACLDEGRDCVHNPLGAGFTCSTTCHQTTSDQCVTYGKLCDGEASSAYPDDPHFPPDVRAQTAAIRADYVVTCLNDFGCKPPFVASGGQCVWKPNANPGDPCLDDYECSSAKCVPGKRSMYQVTSEYPWKDEYGTRTFTDSADTNACFEADTARTDAAGKAGKCAEAGGYDVPVTACAGFDNLACDQQNRVAVPSTAVVPGLGSTTVYSCGDCKDGYRAQWTILSPEGCATMWQSYYALGDNKNQNYNSGHELEQEPNVATLRRLLLQDADPTKDATPEMFAKMDAAGAGPVLVNWQNIKNDPDSDFGRVYRRSRGQDLSQFWLSDCNKSVWKIPDPNAKSTDANPLALGLHWSAFADPALNYQACVAKRQPDGAACPATGVALDRAHAGENCISGFCAADASTCEKGFGPTFEETQGSTRDDQNKGDQPDNDIGGIALTQASNSVIRVAPTDDTTVTDRRTYAISLGASYGVDVFGLLQFDVLDVDVKVTAEKEKKKAEYDQSVSVFGLDVPIPPPDRPDAVDKVTHPLADCSAGEWENGEWTDPDCKTHVNADGSIDVPETIEPLELEIPLPIGDCEEWGKESKAVAKSGVIQKGKLCFKETSIVGIVPITVKAEVEINALLALGAVVDEKEMQPAFEVAPGIGIGLNVHGGVGIEEFVTVYAGVHASITIVEITFPVVWTLRSDELSDANQRVIDGLYRVKFTRDVDLELKFLKMSLGLFLEMGVGPFTHEWDWDLIGFDGIKVTFTLKSDTLLSTKVDFEWQP